MGTVLSVNLAVPEANSATTVGITGINKQPVTGPVLVRAPGPKMRGAGSGLVGDQIFDVANHGGDDQAVYVYAREDYDWWQEHLGRVLANGLFGENLTTAGIDVNGAVIGERWRIGADLVVQATFARVPCGTFQEKIAEPHWIRKFVEKARPGAYMRVIEPGEVAAGDEVTVIDRPAHGVTISEGFRAWTLEPRLLPRLLEADEAPADLRDHVWRWPSR